LGIVSAKRAVERSLPGVFRTHDAPAVAVDGAIADLEGLA
jgi:hypothetical protein